MSRHNHHHCQCKHANVRYCACCKVVYCLDCAKEWKENWYTHYNQWGYSTPTIYPMLGTLTVGDTVSANSTLSTQCDHRSST